MTKNDYIEIFNGGLSSRISMEQILPATAEYLQDIKFSKISEMLNLIQYYPQLINEGVYETLEEHMCKKYNICKLLSESKQIIKYYG